MVPAWKLFFRHGIDCPADYSNVDPNLPFQENSSTKDIISLMCSLQMESPLASALRETDCAIVISYSGSAPVRD